MMSRLVYLMNVVKLNRSLFPLLFNHSEIYSEWKNQIDSKKSPLDLELPWITIVAKNYLEEYFKNKPRNTVKVFEYGSGGSSLFFLKHASEVVSVEHDPKWFSLVAHNIRERNIQGWDGHLLEAEEAGIAVDDLDTSNPHHYYSGDKNFAGHTFRKYASHISGFPDEYFDVVLVDGRSRPSCLFHSVNKVKRGGLLILDNAERRYYSPKKIIPSQDFNLVSSLFGALICYDQFTLTNIYMRK
jgi:predicted O-methyltransferase YrrM